MDLYSIIQTEGKVKFEVTGEDLVKFAEILIEKSQEAKAREIELSPTEDKLLTANEAAEMCHICLTTLWAWDKAGYLVPCKMGKRRYYKESEIKKMMNERADRKEPAWPTSTKATQP